LDNKERRQSVYDAFQTVLDNPADISVQGSFHPGSDHLHSTDSMLHSDLPLTVSTTVNI